MSKDSYVKDVNTGIVHNMDDTGLKSIMTLRERVKKEKQLTRELQSVQDELTEIKALLQDFMRNKNV